MRIASSSTVGALQGSVNHRYLADIIYDGERRLQDIPIEEVSFTEDAGSSIQMSGSCTVVWTDEFGRSISPKQIGDTLSPFGPELHLFSIVSVGLQEERIPLGQFPITNVPSAQDEDMLFRGEWITTGSVVKLEFKDHLYRVDQDRFDVPSAPLSLESVFAEAGRITGLPLSRTVADAAITRAVMYQENRLEALQDLFELLDAVPHMTPYGALSARPKTWGDPVDRLRRGDPSRAVTGQIVSVGRAMSASKVYNRVAFRGKSGQQQKILASAEVEFGPLRTKNPDGSRSPFGRVTKFLSSDLVTTAAQAQEWVDRELPRVSRLGSVVLPVEEFFNPLRERGDVIVLERAREELVGRVLSVKRGSKATQDLEVEVLGE